MDSGPGQPWDKVFGQVWTDWMVDAWNITSGDEEVREEVGGEDNNGTRGDVFEGFTKTYARTQISSRNYLQCAKS